MTIPNSTPTRPSSHTFRARAASFLLGTAALVSGAVLPLGGCVVISTASGCTDQAKFTAELPTQLAYSKPGGLDVETNNGAIKVIGGGTSETIDIRAKVKAITQERADAVRLVATQDDAGNLVIRAKWPQDQRKPNEGVAITITLPDTAWVRLKGDNGELSCSKVTGVGEFTTSNGSISVVDHRGDIKLHSSNGAIKAKNVSGSLHAKSSNGRIEAAAVAGFVEAQTTNGAIDVKLTDDSNGPVKLETTNGSVDLRVGPGFTGQLEASTSNGTISAQADGATVKTKSRKQLTLGFTDAGVKSEVKTSNGSINITGPGR